MESGRVSANISFLWWNTSLSPGGKNRATDFDSIKVEEMVNFFTRDLEVDLIVLGEVHTRDIENIRAKCFLDGYELKDANEKVGRSSFHTCLIFNTDKLALEGLNNIAKLEHKRTLKIAQLFVFSAIGHSVPLFLFVSHWPSRLYANAAESREYLAIRLRDQITPLLEEYKDEASVVLLGDFNDEPFDISLSRNLKATRDRGTAKRTNHLLYNPFWRSLGHASPYKHCGAYDNDDAGTYYYKSGEVTKWLTFDQIIFSSRYLGGSSWHLNEELTRTLEIPEYKKLVVNPKEIFDHLPVIGVIEEVI